jgi:hypothetical protein
LKSSIKNAAIRASPTAIQTSTEGAEIQLPIIGMVLHLSNFLLNVRQSHSLLPVERGFRNGILRRISKPYLRSFAGIRHQPHTNKTSEPD